MIDRDIRSIRGVNVPGQGPGAEAGPATAALTDGVDPESEAWPWLERSRIELAGPAPPRAQLDTDLLAPEIQGRYTPAQLAQVASDLAGMTPEQTALYLRPAFAQDPEATAELLRQLGAARGGKLQTAYETARAGVALIMSDTDHGTAVKHRAFVAAVAGTSGPGAANLKADTAIQVAANLGASSSPAEHAEQGRQLAMLLHSDPIGVVEYLNRHDELQHDRAVDRVFRGVLEHHPQGEEILGSVLGTVAAGYACLEHEQPGSRDARSAGVALGRAMGAAENAIEAIVHDEDVRAGKARRVLDVATFALMLTFPPPARRAAGMVLLAAHRAAPHDPGSPRRAAFHEGMENVCYAAFVALSDQDGSGRAASPNSDEARALQQARQQLVAPILDGYEEVRARQR